MVDTVNNILCEISVELTKIEPLHISSLSKKFVQYVYKNFSLQILGYINVVPFKILPIWHNTLVPPPFPSLEASLEFLFS